MVTTCNTILAPPDLAIPVYSIYKLGSVYKIVKFKSDSPRLLPLRDGSTRHENRLSQSVSRARKVLLEKSLCNPWRYFATFTLDPAKYDRNNLGGWYSDFGQWLRDRRKAYRKSGFDFDLPYLLVPEMHKDGAWHMHGLFSDDISPFLVSFRQLADSGCSVPVKLLNGDYYDWPDYHRKFGFCSFGVIRDPIACGFYICKYMSKAFELEALPRGAKLYYCSIGLNNAVKQLDVYRHSVALDSYLSADYEYCAVGYTHADDNLDWSFALEFGDDPPDMDPLSYTLPYDGVPEWEYMQVIISGVF